LPYIAVVLGEIKKKDAPRKMCRAHPDSETGEGKRKKKRIREIQTTTEKDHQCKTITG